ncbi:MAG: type II secretion system protein N, partial [Magnetococcales bacterium]|nr:type II secretion system protein N [Magnetococcales bacterium]
NAESLRTFFPAIPAGSRGRLQGSMEELLLDRQGRVLALRARGEARGLFIGAPVGIELGDFKGEAAPAEGGGVRLRVAELAGPWQARLTAQLDPDGQYRVRGTVALKEQADPRLGGLLRLVGPMDASGRASVHESGRLFGS